MNGYTLFWKEALQNRVRKPGESSNHCRKRVLSEVKQQWARLSAEIKTQYRDRAKASNSLNHARSMVAACRDMVHPDTTEVEAGQETVQEESDLVVIGGEHQIAEYLPGQANALGVMGSGDENFGLAEAIVEKADEDNPTFVKTWASRWRNNHDGICGENAEFKNTRGTVQLSCLQEFPGVI